MTAHIAGVSMTPFRRRPEATVKALTAEAVEDALKDAGLTIDDVDAVDVHMVISAFCVFRTANRHTFQAVFDRDMLDPARRDHYRRMLGELVVEYLTAHVGRD